MTEPLLQIGLGIWVADGPVVSFFGFRYPTRMAVIRLSDGGVFVWSPVALVDGIRGAIDALGPLRHLVSPNSLHHFWLGAWKAAYPGGGFMLRRGCGGSGAILGLMPRWVMFRRRNGRARSTRWWCGGVLLLPRWCFFIAAVGRFCLPI